MNEFDYTKLMADIKSIGVQFDAVKAAAQRAGFVISDELATNFTARLRETSVAPLVIEEDLIDLTDSLPVSKG